MNKTANRKSTRTNTRQAYMYDNTARQLDTGKRVRRQEPERQVQPQRGLSISLGYAIFLIAALCTLAFILINYVQLQSELKTATRTLAINEKTLNNLTMANDELENRIERSIDIQEIKRVAIEELGMVYPSEGQIQVYTNEVNDYMRQVIAD